MATAIAPVTRFKGARGPTSLRFLYQLLGVIAALLIWQLLTSGNVLQSDLARGFSPSNTFRELGRFVASGEFAKHSGPSLWRFCVGLSFALIVGVPIGIVVGYFPKVHLATNTVFQFIRMTSPLAWMPLAIILFGVGTKPVCFLVAVAAVWPIVINTAHGVRSVEPVWIKVVRMLGGHDGAVLRRAVIPAIIPDMLTGLRISVGVSWIVLVPAEMLGVSSGLGYYILDTRDRFNYGELMAVILVVGFFGFMSDLLIRLAQRQFSWPSKAQETEQW